MPEGVGYPPAQRGIDMNTIARFALSQRGVQPTPQNFSQMKQQLINTPELMDELVQTFHGQQPAQDPTGNVIDDETFRPGTRSFDEFWRLRLAEVEDAAERGAARGAEGTVVNNDRTDVRATLPAQPRIPVTSEPLPAQTNTAATASGPAASEGQPDATGDDKGPPLVPPLIPPPPRQGQLTSVQGDIDNTIDAEFRVLDEQQLPNLNTQDLSPPVRRIAGPTDNVEGDIINRIDEVDGTPTQSRAGAPSGRAAPQQGDIADRVVSVGETGLGRTTEGNVGGGIGQVQTPQGNVRVVSITLDDGTKYFVDGRNNVYDVRGTPQPQVRVDLAEVAEKFGDARFVQTVRRLAGAVRGAL